MKRSSFDGPTVGVAALIFGVIGFIVADLAGTESVTTVGHVSSKDHKEAWTEVTSELYKDLNGNYQTRVSTERHPEEWWVFVDLDKGEGSLKISRSLYSRLDRGQAVGVTYSLGRFTGMLSIHQVRVLDTNSQPEK
jgi:hypothetical protein